jgi:hypothetical protein
VANDQTVFRVACRHKPYAQLGNAMLRDKSMSLEARGFLAFILSFPPNWQFALGWLCRNQGIGRHKARRIVRENIMAGYCMRRQERTATGSWGPIEYVFSDESCDKKAPQSENPPAADPPADNRPPTKDFQSQRTERDEHIQEGELHIKPSGTDGATGNRLPFTADVLKAIDILGLDVTALVERYVKRTAGRRIADPSAYLLKMARDEAAKRLGVSAAALEAAASRDRARRATAQAASVGATAEPTAAVLRGVERRALLRGEKPGELVTAWRGWVGDLPLKTGHEADQSLLAFELSRRAAGRVQVPEISELSASSY